MTDVVATLDDWGRPAWIALMVGGFVVFWPVGLAILAFLLWSGRMGCGRNGRWGEEQRARWQEKFERWGRPGGCFRGVHPSGNRAFDEYREATLRRLEEEAREFTAYLDRLRQAKDKAEFDQFMAERRNPPQAPTSPQSPPQGI